MDDIDQTFDRLRRPSLSEMAALFDIYVGGQGSLLEVERRISMWASNYSPRDDYSSSDMPLPQFHEFYKSHNWHWKDLRKAAHEYIGRRDL